MAGDFKIYDSNEVTLNVVGIPIDSLGGYSDDEFCTIEFDEPAFVIKRGTDGSVTRSKTNCQSGKCKIKLMQSSPANAALSALLTLDRKSGNGAGVGPLTIKDRQGLDLHFASKAWVEGPPNAPYGKDAKEREWTIAFADMESFSGGA